MKFELRNMDEGETNIRLDVWLDSKFVGELSVPRDQYERLIVQQDDGELEFEVVD